MLQPGKNAFTARLNPFGSEQGGVYITLSIGTERARSRWLTFVDLSGETQKVTENVEANGEGELQVAYGILDASTLLPLYASSLIYEDGQDVQRRGRHRVRRPVESIRATIQALQGIPALFGALAQPYDTAVTAPPTPFTKAWLLRCALDATGGVLLYDRMPLDGRSWLAIAETTRLVAAFEELLLTGARSALPGTDESSVQVLSGQTETAICVMNGTGKETRQAISFPADLGKGVEFYSGNAVAGGETVDCLLPPGEAFAYVFEK